MSTSIPSGGCECLRAGIRLKWRTRSTQEGTPNDWEPQTFTIESVSGSAGDVVFSAAALDAGYLNHMITGLVADVSIFPPDTYITLIDVDAGTFTTSAPAKISFSDIDLTVGGWLIKEWLGPRTDWYDVSQGDLHGCNGLVNTSRSSSDTFVEAEFEFKLIGAQITTTIEGDWIRGDTDAAVSAFGPETLADDDSTTGVLNAVIPADGAGYNGIYLGNLKFKIAFYRDPI